MPTTGGSITIQWSAPTSAVVSITGGAANAFTVNGNPVSFPYALASTTKFDTVTDGSYTVSVLLNGYEIASTPDGVKVVQLVFGNALSINPSVDDLPDNGFAASLSATYVPNVDPSTVNKRIASRYQPVFDSSFEFSKISSVQDGLLVWQGLNVSAGAATPTYFKAVGGSITHSGPGNLDVFWASVTHTGPREAGLFIGDLTGSSGGNLYGAHFLVTPSTVAPAVVEGVMAELAPSVARGSNEWYGVHARNSGTQQASAGVHVDGANGGTFLYGINVDKTAGAGALGAALRLSGGANWSNMIQGFAADGSTQIFRVTASGRADFTTGGVTTKYTSGATQPAFLVNGQCEVWHDTGTGNDYIVVNVNGVSKKALLS